MSMNSIDNPSIEFSASIQPLDVTEAMKSLLWNRQLLKYIGVWPLEISHAFFLFFFIYLLVHCLLTFAELTLGKHNFDVNMAIIDENVLHLMTLIKITMCWINRQSLRRLLIEVQDNFLADNYNTFEKRFIFMKYAKLAKYYFFVAVPSMTIAIGFYYIQELISNVKMAMSNSSWSYKLPYKTRTFVDIRDIRIYTCLCIYQILVPPSIVLGFVGFDCLFTNLAFHITAQFGVLSCMLREILDDSRGFQCNMKELVLRHYKLIRQAKTLEDKYNVIILQQLMGSTFQLCASGYYTLLERIIRGSVDRDGLTLFIFCTYAFAVLSTLFIYCYIGECLIQEVIEINCGDTGCFI
ncbi:hypothetical protein HZH68_017143 [Vespula germanica]|uniref:Odorant receptor n=1 Tax=Vespula germanica TaxID=30212 RepID=A0A834IZE9_VESGE|nr:hypothetical protein HZH68_017143 [Vespula germanica]